MKASGRPDHDSAQIYENEGLEKPLAA